MEKNYLSKESVDPEIYAPPVCDVIIVGTQRVICGSETETVGEIEGEW